MQRASCRLRDPVPRRIVVVQANLVRAEIVDVSRRELRVKVGRRFVRLDDRLERRRDLLAREGLPVDGLEERVLFELFGIALRA